MSVDARVITLRFKSLRTKRAMERLAKANNRSLTAEINALCEAYVRGLEALEKLR
jgi:hypothetical protein